MTIEAWQNGSKISTIPEGGTATIQLERKTEHLTSTKEGFECPESEWILETNDLL
jgi:hypothetical protein